MGDGFREIDLEDAEQGPLKLLVVIEQDDDPWGVLAPLRETKWGGQIQVVTGEAFSHALHGWATPLARELGVAPKVRARRTGILCALQGSCLGFKPHCRPGPELPDCYEAPDLEWSASILATRIALAWRENRYVVVVKGKGFVLT